MPATAVRGRPHLVAETVIVLGLSLGRAAAYSILNIINRLTLPDLPLAEQTSTMNSSVTPDRPWLDLAFQFVSATDSDQGRVVMTDAMMNIQWQSVSLYVAGIRTSRQPITARVTYPAGWKAGTAWITASARPAVNVWRYALLKRSGLTVR